MEDGIIPLVLDNGSGMCKAGFAGEDIPRSIFPTVTGSCIATEGRASYVGYEATSRENVSLCRPVQNGIITDWDQMETIWHHTFHNDLNVTTQDRPILLTETLMNPRSHREKIQELFFETYSASHICIAAQPVLALYASGRTTGVVFESGHSCCSCVPVFEGRVVAQGVLHGQVSGGEVDARLEQLIRQQGVTLPRDVISDIKEKLCYIPQDYKLELTSAKTRNYELPDGTNLTLHPDTLTAPEIIFTPSLTSITSPGAHQLINSSILSCNRDIHRSMFSNVLLSSGNTMFPGIARRMQQELTALSPRAKLKLTVPAERKYAVWIGGSILASMHSFQHIWLCREQYEEGSYGRRYLEC